MQTERRKKEVCSARPLTPAAASSATRCEVRTCLLIHSSLDSFCNFLNYCPSVFAQLAGTCSEDT